MNVRLYLLILILTLRLISSAEAQTVKKELQLPHYSIGAKYSRGFIIVHSPMMSQIATGPVQSGELFFEIQTRGRKTWQQIHASPSFRLAYIYHDFSNPQKVGTMHTITPEACMPLVRSKYFALNFNVAIGMGYVTRPFNAVTNFQNAGLGSHLNAHIRFGLESRVRISKNLRFISGLSFTHWSAGAFVVPNLGVNVPAFYVGFSYGFKNEWLKDYPKPLFTSQPYEVYVHLNGSRKQISPIFDRSYPALSAIVRINKQLTRKSIVGAGLDLCYDGTIPQRLFQKNGTRGSVGQSFRAGIHISYEFLIQRFSLYFNFGAYFLKTDNLDYPIYQRIGVSYRIGKNWMVNLGLKSHLFTADFIEPGIAYRVASFRFKSKKTAK
jgi:hypothetical protein